MLASPTEARKLRPEVNDCAAKVAHTVLSMEVGGLESIVVDLVRESARRGQAATVVCLQRTGPLAEQVEALGAQVVCVHKRPGIRLETFSRLRSLLRELRPDVVHTHQIGALFYAGPAAKRAGVPLVVHTEHGKHYGDRRRTRWVGQLAGRHAARFLCVSEDIAAAAAAHRIVPRAKIHVVPNGIDLARFREPPDRHRVRRSLGIPIDAPLIGTVGRLSEIKRQDLLIRAFQLVLGRVRDAHLIIVGDGPEMGKLRELVAGLELDARVHFAGYQPHPEAHLQAMDVFALSSRSEGMPLAVLEAWATGLPVVATRVGGLPELIDEGTTGVLVESGDEISLAGALGDVIADRDFSRRLGAAGKDRVESQFSLQRMADEYQRHYAELLERERN